jgi:ABC-2 type transport system permease protein
MTDSASRRSRLLSTLVAASASNASATARDGNVGVGLFLLPLVVITVIGVAMQGYSKPVFTVGFLDPQQSALSAALRSALADEPTVDIRDYRDPRAMQAAVYRGRLHAAVVVPADWDGHGDLEIHATAAGVGAIVVRAIAEARLARAVTPEATREVPSRVYDGGPEQRPPIGFHYTAPSNLVLFLTISGLVSCSGVLLMRQRGITRRLLATPARTHELIVLVLVGPAQLMAVQAAFLVASTAFAFDVPWGDPLGVLLLTFALLTVACALTLLMSTVFRSPQQAFSLAPLISITLGMLGGCMWPLSIAPAWLRDFGHAFPTAWAMDGYIALIFEDARFQAVLPSVAILFAMAAALGCLGVLRFRKGLGA